MNFSDDMPLDSIFGDAGSIPMDDAAPPVQQQQAPRAPEPEFVPASTTSDVGDLDYQLGLNTAPGNRPYIMDSMPPTWQGSTVGGLGNTATSGAFRTLLSGLAAIAVAGAATYWLTRDWKPAVGVAAMAWGAGQIPHSLGDGPKRFLIGAPAVVAGAGLLWWSQKGPKALANMMEGFEGEGYEEDDDDDGYEDDEPEGEGYDEPSSFSQVSSFPQPSSAVSNMKGRPNWIKPSTEVWDGADFLS